MEVDPRTADLARAVAGVLDLDSPSATFQMRCILGSYADNGHFVSMDSLRQILEHGDLFSAILAEVDHGN